MLIFLFHCLFLPYVPRFFFSCLKKFSLSFSKSPFSTKLLVFLRENVISPFYLRIVPLDIKLEVDRSFLLTLEDIPGYMSGNARCGWSSVGGKTPSTWCCSRLAHLPITLQFSSGCLWCHIFFEPKCIIVLNTFCKKVCSSPNHHFKKSNNKNMMVLSCPSRRNRAMTTGSSQTKICHDNT